MKKEKKLNINELSLAINVSLNTINYWYRFKKHFPEEELSKELPDFEQEGEKATRYWKQSDVWKLIEFKKKVPHGRNGVMGAITQKYVNKTTKGGKKNEKGAKCNTAKE